MSIIFGGIKTSNNIDFLSLVTEDGVKLEIPIEKASAERIKKYLQRILPTEPLDSITTNNVRCVVCLKEFEEGDLIISSHRRDGEAPVCIHESCEKLAAIQLK
jgi:hypothetical protein